MSRDNLIALLVMLMIPALGVAILYVGSSR